MLITCLLQLLKDSMLISWRLSWSHTELTFSMKYLGLDQKIFGLKLFRDHKARKLWLSQQKYVEKVFAKFNMGKVKLVNTPLEAQFLLSEAQCPTNGVYKDLMSSILYKSVVDSFMYFIICTWLYIVFAVGKVSRYMSNPRCIEKQWNKYLDILRYSYGMADCLMPKQWMPSLF